METPTPDNVFAFFITGQGRMIASGLLWSVLAALKQWKWLQERLVTAWHLRAFALCLALIPMIAGSLASDVPLPELSLTGIMAFGLATGWNRIITDIAPKLGAKPEAWPVVIGQQLLDQYAAQLEAKRSAAIARLRELNPDKVPTEKEIAAEMKRVATVPEIEA